MSAAITTRFSAADQRTFAALSGDRNPLHLDPVAARRVAAGEPVVHGMHLLLRMLDARVRRRPASDIRIDATFLHPAVVGEPIGIRVDAEGQLVAEAGDALVALVTLDAGREPTPRVSVRSADRPQPIPPRPRVRSLTDIAAAHGVLAPKTSPAARRAFPAAVRSLGADMVCALASLSALVGMECPGRDSLLSAVRLRIEPHARVPRIAWRVCRVDRRFGLVRIDVAGDGLAGTVDAFVRPGVVPPPPFSAVAARVRPGEFEGQRALIVGGSRGLGAVTAMLVAAGGGLPVVTYAAGGADAAAIRRTIRDAGHGVETLRLDVTAGDAADVVARAVRRFDIADVYFFASPRIFARRGAAPFDAALFDRFAAVFVHAFARVCAAATRDGRALDVFYPSSQAVAEPPTALTEYAAAKAAGESVCRAMERSTEKLRMLVSRLPRVATDQTASIVPAAAADPLDVMLPIVREMHVEAAEKTR